MTGGFAEISATGVSVLAERAVPLEEMTPAIMDSLVADVTAASQLGGDRDVADKVAADLAAMRIAAGQ